MLKFNTRFKALVAFLLAGAAVTHLHASTPLTKPVVTPVMSVSTLIGKTITPPRRPGVMGRDFGSGFFECGGSMLLDPAHEGLGLTILRIGAKTQCEDNGKVFIVLKQTSNNGATVEILDAMEVVVPKKHIFSTDDCSGAIMAIVKNEATPFHTKARAAWRVVGKKFVATTSLSAVKCINPDPDL